MGRDPLPHISNITTEQCLEMGQTCTAFNLRRVTRLVSQYFDDALRPSGLKITQFSLLVAARMYSRLIMGKMASIMGMDRTTLSRNLKLLEKKGLVELGPGRDRREVHVSLTSQGLAALEQAVPLWYQAQSSILDKFGRERWEALVKELGDLRRTLKS